MERSNKVWMHYVKNIIAADVSSAIFLTSYLRHNTISKKYATSLEIIDLQRYKVIKQAPKVKQALKERMNIPFIFAVGLN